MMWDTSKIRNITTMEHLLRILAFLKIGPNSATAQTLKFQINEHLSADDEGETELRHLSESVKAEFLPDHGCRHREYVSERNSECARRRGKAFVADCDCGFCKAINEAWLADVWGSGVEQMLQYPETGDHFIEGSLAQPNYIHGGRVRKTEAETVTNIHIIPEEAVATQENDDADSTKDTEPTEEPTEETESVEQPEQAEAERPDGSDAQEDEETGTD